MNRPWSRWLLVSGLMLCFAAPGPAAEKKAERTAAPQVVQVIVDYADGVQKHFVSISWKRGMTVLDAMQIADQHPHGIAIVYRGAGATALLTRIDDVANEGAGRNWVYRVNGKLADRGMGVYELHSGDAILWKFEKYQ